MGRILLILSIALISLVQINSRAQQTQYSSRFVIEKPEWSAQDEQLFGNFVRSLGESNCATLDECLKSPVNPWQGTDPQEFSVLSDCADLPYVLRSYFAFKNKLPFTYTSRVFNMDPIVIPTDDELKFLNITIEDYLSEQEVQRAMTVQYSQNGNFPIARRSNVRTPSKQAPNYYQMFWDMRETISSGTYRMHPEIFENPDLLAAFDYDPLEFTDLYPVKISRESIRPGTILYDPSGHVAIVYRIEDDGRIRLLDAHPDNSLTRITYGPSFERSRPAHGAGFKNWRPIKLTYADVLPTGQLVGGMIETIPNSQLSDYSTEQYYGIQRDPEGQWNKGLFIYEGKKLDYYTYVRTVMSRGKLTFNPLLEFRNQLVDLCANFKYRSEAVNKAIAAGLPLQNHPPQLPDNIYGTTGDWENFSTPSRDARIKVQLNDIYKQTKNYLNLYYNKDPQLSYQGQNLKQDLANIYFQESSACQISYVNSAGQNVDLNLDQIISRIFKLSFDPYHSIELRWGDVTFCYTSGSEQCQWYNAEYFLRNQHNRTYEAKMNFTLDDLFKDLIRGKPSPGNGIAAPLQTNIKSLL